MIYMSAMDNILEIKRSDYDGVGQIHSWILAFCISLVRDCWSSRLS